MSTDNAIKLEDILPDTFVAPEEPGLAHHWRLGELAASFDARIGGGENTVVLKHRLGGQPIRVPREHLGAFNEYAETLGLRRENFHDVPAEVWTAYHAPFVPQMPTDWSNALC